MRGGVQRLAASGAHWVLYKQDLLLDWAPHVTPVVKTPPANARD